MQNTKIDNRPTGKLPVVRLRPALPDRLLEAAALLLVVASWVYVICNYGSGEAALGTMLAAASSITITVAALALAARMPSNMYNFPVRVTVANIAMQYMMAVRMVRVMNVVVGFMGLAIVIACVHRWAMVLVYVSLGLMAAVLVAYFVLACRRK